MMCLLALTDKVLRESGILSAGDLQAQVDPAQLLVWFVSGTGLPLSVVASAMERFSPQIPMFVVSEGSDITESAPQTVDTVITSSDVPPILLSMLQSLSEPVRVVPCDEIVTAKVEFDNDRPRVLADLKSLIDSFPLMARKNLIAEVRAVMVELIGAEQKAQSISTTLDHFLRTWTGAEDIRGTRP